MNNKMKKTLRNIPCLIQTALITGCLALDEACANYRNVTAPFKRKGAEMGEIIVDGFGIAALVVLAVITVRWSLTDKKEVQKSMEEWGKRILIGATLIYCVGTGAIFLWMKS